MADNNSANEGSIRAYLTEHGGSVSDAGGRGLTDEMARAIGIDKPAALSAILGQMERDGSITREMRGLRTYRIALANGDSAPPPPPSTAEVEVAAAPAGGRRFVSLRESASSRATVASSVETADAPPAKAVSLRDALNQRPAAATVASPTLPLPPPTSPPERSGGRAVSLRDALAGNADPSPSSAPSPWEDPTTEADWSVPTGPRVASLRGSTPPAAPSSSWGADVAPQTKRDKARTKRNGSRPRMSISVIPAVKSPPSMPTMVAVGVVVAGLVIVAIVAVVASRASVHPVTIVGTPDSSAFACNLVTPADASAAFGDPAGIPHYVLGSCVYADATHELIIDVDQQDGRAQFDQAETSTAQNVPGIGDGAFYDNGTLRVLQGQDLMLLTLTPYSSAGPSPKLLALATMVTPNLGG